MDDLEMLRNTKEDEECDLPLYSTPGRILICAYVRQPAEPFYNAGYKYDVDLIDSDHDTSVFWIEEGVGTEYWVCQHCDIEYDGWYVVEGITGYVCGDDYDAQEYWEFASMRKATVDEMLYEGLK